MMDSANSEYNQYLCFMLAGEVYAFRIINVKEVVFFTPSTPLPSAYDFLSGVINLHGRVIPVIDLRKKFHLGQCGNTEDTSIIILEKSNETESNLIGAVVDAVFGVVFFPDLSIGAPPGFGMKIDPGIVRGFSTSKNKLVVILDAEKIFAPDIFRITGSQQ